LSDVVFVSDTLDTWRWRRPILLLTAIVFFVPMQRYTFPVSAPINLEPYRVLVGLLMLGWLLSLLTMESSARRTSLDVPILLFVLVICASLVANPGRFAAYQAEGLKNLSTFASFFITFFLLTSVLRRREEIEYLVRLIVSFGAVVGAFAVIEARTGFSPFTHLRLVMPFLRDIQEGFVTVRGGRIRAFGSAEHPIALGALLVMVVPFGIYLAVATRRRIWWACTVALVLGALATVSRTPVLMLFTLVTVYAVARWEDVRRQWIWLFPLVAVIHFSAPGTLGAIKNGFLPSGGLISQQNQLGGSSESGGRVTDIGPSLDEWAQKPLLGTGMGTRISTGENANGRLLDDQWLGLLIDGGAAGILVVAWIVIRFSRQQLALARGMRGPPGYLPLACASSVIAYAVGMFTFDSFAFAQVTFFLFMVLALGVALQLVVDTPPRRRSSPGSSPAMAAPVVRSPLKSVS